MPGQPSFALHAQVRDTAPVARRWPLCLLVPLYFAYRQIANYFL
jgi:hypothetical protein